MGRSLRADLIRSRWAALGAAVAVSLGAGGLAITHAVGTTPSEFVAITPERILDTRVDLGLAGPFASRAPRTVQVTGPVSTPLGSGTVVPPGGTAVVLNVTAVRPSAAGFLSVRPDGTPGAPTTSNLNFASGVTVPNAVTVALPANGRIEVTFDAYGSLGPVVEVLIDVTGYYVPGSDPPGEPLDDNDTLGDLQCAAGQIAKWNGASWECASDQFGGQYDNVIVVAKSGGDHTSVASALASITDASAANPYLVHVRPGTYTEGELVDVPSHVHLRGDGRDMTIIQSSRSSGSPSAAAAIVELSDQSTISHLTVRNSGTGTFGIGVYTTAATRGTLIDEVIAEAVGAGGVGHYAVYLNDAEPTIQHSSLRASGAVGFGTSVNAAVGVVNVSGGFPRPLITDSQLIGGNGDVNALSCAGNSGTGFAIQGANAAPEVVGSYLCGDRRSVAIFTNGITRVHDSQLWASSTGGSFLIETTISATVIVVNSGVFYVGNKFTGTGGLVCTNAYKANFTPATDGATSGTACN